MHTNSGVIARATFGGSGATVTFIRLLRILLLVTAGLLNCDCGVARQTDTGDGAKTESSTDSGDSAAENDSSYPLTSPEDVFSDNETLVLPPVDHGEEAIDDFELPQDTELSGQPSASIVDPCPTQPECGEAVCISDAPDSDAESRMSFYESADAPFTVYRSKQNVLGWMPGSGQDFGWFDWASDPYIDREESIGITSAFNIHWLSGPNTSPLPPRLYDLAMGFQNRGSFSDRFSYDLYSGIGLFTDFEGSARDGVRFPAHAVGMLHVNSSADIVFGIDWLDRDQVSLLPVFGVSLHDLAFRGLRLDLVFPRPRIEYAFSDTHRVYLAGSTGGGKWDIDFPDGSDQVMSYRDYRLGMGFERADEDGGTTALEFGWVFSRSLEFRRMQGDTRFDDALLIRWVTRR